MDMRELLCGLRADELRRVLSGDSLTEDQQRRVLSSIKTPLDRAVLRRAILKLA